MSDADGDSPIDPVFCDARRFGSFASAGGWMFGLMVARSVYRDEQVAGRISVRAFAEEAGCAVDRVLRHWNAWQEAASDELVPDAGTLVPGADTELPEGDLWPKYYAAPGASSDRGQRVRAEAEALGASYKKALEITGHRPAMKAAIWGDHQTAEAAREALFSRPQERTATLARALADPDTRKAAKVEQKRVDHLEYVRRALEEKTAKSPAGQVVELGLSADELADERLNAIRDACPDAEAVEQAYDYVQELVERAVRADPDLYVREQRARFTRAFSATSRNIQSIDPDDLMAVADEALVDSLTDLQNRVNDLAATLRAVCA
ncbi:hypothetical protein [Actinomadura sp. NTSP31]|uniref:hypothetical protein n=1 Tax=Actinomadura sp. NTSP31 TaxID=1735447 RepID=UPI0035C254E6